MSFRARTATGCTTGELTNKQGKGKHHHEVQYSGVKPVSVMYDKSLRGTVIPFMEQKKTGSTPTCS